MKAFSIVDESFDPVISSSYFISIQITLDGFSFCILDPVRNKYIQMQHIPLDGKQALIPQVEECFASVEKLNLPYKKCMVLLPSNIATLVPSSLYENGDEIKWLSFSHTLSDSQGVATNKVRMADAFNIFAVNHELERILRRQFPAPSLYQQYTPIIEGNLATMADSEKPFVIINLENEYFDLLVFRENNLKLCNSFPIKSESDFLYFCLFVFEQLKLNSQTTEVLMFGRHPRFSELENLLSDYIKKVRHSNMPHQFQYSHQFRSLDTPEFYNMLSLPLCV